VEQALKLALASPSREDRQQPRKIKILIRNSWGDWKKLKDQIPRSTERSIITYLADHPTSFGRAFELLDPPLRILYVSAYQSYLWNRVLAERIRQLPDTFEVPYSAGTLLFYRSLSEDRIFELSIPLLTPTSPLDDVTQKLLAEEGLEQRQFRLKKLERTFFGKGNRAAIFRPSRWSAATGEDELNQGKKKVTLSFELPKGSYATVLLKALNLKDEGEADRREVELEPE
jgi:tRNA pseudouridine13 synthase